MATRGRWQFTTRAERSPPCDELRLEFLDLEDLLALVRNDGLVDGNKRVGWLAIAAFLELNGRPVSADDDAVFDLVMQVDEGAVDVEEIAATDTMAGHAELMSSTVHHRGSARGLRLSNT